MSVCGGTGGMALSGIRVIDFGQGGIIPLATSYLADFGAEVIKVESSGHLDFARRSELFVDETRDPDRNVGFARYNQNKMSVQIDLKQAKGVDLAKRLVRLADVVTENLAVDAMHVLGLDYEQLRKEKPDIIMISASFGGQTGPYRNYRGQGFTIAALQGVVDLTGWPDREPVSPGTAFCDHYIPWVWAIAILSALEHRRRTGQGQFIDGSTFEGCIDVLDTAVADYSVNNRVLTRQGNRHPVGAPHGIFRCRGEDRWIAIAVFTDEEWARLVELMRAPAWTSETQFATLSGRLHNADALERLVEAWTQEQVAEDAVRRLQGVGIAADVVKTMADLVTDPQLTHRSHFWEAEESGLELFTFEAPPARLSKTPASLQRRFPLLGEHNAYVYSELLNLSAEEYAQFVEDGIIR